MHTARPGVPFPVAAAALVGPRDLAPLVPLDDRSYTLLEATPLYFGVSAKQRECRRAARLGRPRGFAYPHTRLMELKAGCETCHHAPRAPQVRERRRGGRA